MNDTSLADKEKAEHPTPNIQRPTSKGPKLRILTRRANQAGIEKLFADLRKIRDERRAAAELARPALRRLCQDILTQRSGQPYKVRALLYSLYNGQPVSLLEVVCLDWAIRQDLCSVILAFGFEESRHEPGSDGVEKPSFYYAEMKAEIIAAGQWEWFIEAHKESEEA